jgi:hypothetical protein
VALTLGKVVEGFEKVRYRVCHRYMLLSVIEQRRMVAQPVRLGAGIISPVARQLYACSFTRAASGRPNRLLKLPIMAREQTVDRAHPQFRSTGR